jgi:hypothetical protein
MANTIDRHMANSNIERLVNRLNKQKLGETGIGGSGFSQPFLYLESGLDRRSETMNESSAIFMCSFNFAKRGPFRRGDDQQSIAHCGQVIARR